MSFRESQLATSDACSIVLGKEYYNVSAIAQRGREGKGKEGILKGEQKDRTALGSGQKWSSHAEKLDFYKLPFS